MSRSPICSWLIVQIFHCVPAIRAGVVPSSSLANSQVGESNIKQFKTCLKLACGGHSRAACIQHAMQSKSWGSVVSKVWVWLTWSHRFKGSSAGNMFRYVALTLTRGYLKYYTNNSYIYIYMYSYSALLYIYTLYTLCYDICIYIYRHTIYSVYFCVAGREHRLVGGYYLQIATHAGI